MYSTIGKTRAALTLPAIVASAAFLFASAAIQAETVRTVNGEAVDSAVVDFYLQSRTNKPPTEITAQEREQMLSELTDIYVLTTQDAAKAVKDDPRVQAQIELQRRGVIAQAVASRFFSNVNITDEEIAAEYKRQTELAPPLQYKARHILVESQGEAEGLITQLNDGADFEALAAEHSTGPSASNGGDLGWFAPNQMVAPFSDAVAKLEDGDYTDAPVQTDFGWHVILREQSRQTEAPPLDSVRNEVVQALQQRRFQGYLEELRNKATIE